MSAPLSSRALRSEGLMPRIQRGERFTPDPLLRIKSPASAVQYVKGPTDETFDGAAAAGRTRNEASGHKNNNGVIDGLFL